MRKLNIIFLFTAYLSYFSTLAQTLESSVISTTGGYFTSSSGSLSWTLGEVISETYQQDAGSLTQGFQQTNVSNSTTEPNVTTALVVDDLNVSVYPNPAYEIINVRSSQPGEHLYELYNIEGQRLIHFRKDLFDTDLTTDIQIQQIPSSTYLLVISNLSMNKTYVSRIVKP